MYTCIELVRDWMLPNDAFGRKSGHIYVSICFTFHVERKLSQFTAYYILKTMAIQSVQTVYHTFCTHTNSFAFHCFLTHSPYTYFSFFPLSFLLFQVNKRVCVCLCYTCVRPSFGDFVTHSHLRVIHIIGSLIRKEI